VIRIDPNRRLGGAVRSTTAAFEIDGIDDRERTGWSVVVTGRRNLSIPRRWMRCVNATAAVGAR